MAIQMRRGANSDFNPSKMLPGEIAVTTDGTRKVYAAFKSNEVKELASKEDVQGLIDGFTSVVNREIAEAEQRIESKAETVLGTIPDDYETLSQKADEAVRTKADAIVCSVSGVNPIANDSSNDYLRNLKLYGKTTQGENPSPNNPQPLESKGKWGNLAYVDIKNTTQFGVTFTEQNGNIIINGTVKETLWNNLLIAKLVAGETYVLSANSSLVVHAWDNALNKSLCNKEVGVNSVTFVAESSGDYIFIIANNVGTTFNNVSADIMVTRKSDNITSYRPYSGQMEIESIVGTDNMLDASNPTVTRAVTTSFDEESGVLTITNNGSWTQWFYDFDAVKGETYKFVCQSLEGVENNNKCLITFSYPNEAEFKSAHMYYKVLDFTATETRKHRLCLFTNQSNNVATDTIKIIKPMLYNVNKSDGVYRSGKKQSHISLVGDGLKGIPVTDSSLATYIDENGVMWCSDYVDCERGVLVQRIERVVVDKGHIPQFQANLGNVSRFYINGSREHDSTISKKYGYSTHLPFKDGFALDEPHWYVYQIHVFFFLPNEIASSQAEIEAWLANGNSIEFQYILETPIETPLTASEIASYKALHSNYKVTSVMNDCGAFMEVQYNADMETWINNAIDSRIAKTLAQYKEE